MIEPVRHSTGSNEHTDTIAGEKRSGMVHLNSLSVQQLYSKHTKRFLRSMGFQYSQKFLFVHWVHTSFEAIRC